jgi:hypothetical protein
MPARQRPPSAARLLIPDQPDLDGLRAAAAGCQACDLYRDATQTVFGEGAAGARVMLVGEQPGDGEDRAGRPFVGPAGRLLDQALAEAGIDRRLAYVTNVVKHFKFERRGKLRLHKKPNAEQVHACLPWLEAELAVVQPRPGQPPARRVSRPRRRRAADRALLRTPGAGDRPPLLDPARPRRGGQGPRLQGLGRRPGRGRRGAARRTRVASRPVERR